ncbi:MAG: sugar nucleotide-binding protein [Pseudolabrys sp.]|nr:sugar nucleotide-binding protein [Pseudolabrys sp.]
MTGILLLGAGGVLGRAFSEHLADQNVAKAGRRELETGPTVGLDRLFAEYRPKLVINCAAHTDLETAEVNPEQDFQANAELPRLIGVACRKNGATLLHFSSTGCYGSWKEAPYSDDDELRPTTAHHRAKAAGEEAVKLSGCRFLVLRTGWLYGGVAGQRKNFVWNRIVEARGKSEMTSDSVQRGCPTFVNDLVRQAMLMVEHECEGVFNAVANGHASRYEYVAEIVAAAGLPCVVKPGPRFRRRAEVSMNEMAINTRLKTLGLDIMPDWTESLRRYVRVLMSSEHPATRSA